MTDINLCTLPFLSVDYSNVIDFESEEKRDSYFKSKTKATIVGNIKYDSARTYINANITLGYLRNFDYLWFEDKEKLKKYFYFITDVEMVTNNNCNLYLKLDVWTTYLFSYSLLPSFVDRCHVPRWNGDIPTQNNEDEGLEKGEIIQIEKPVDICDMEKSVVICSSVPIGLIDKPYSNTGMGGSGGSIGTGDGWKSGKLSRQGFRFIKGFEGFAPQPYQDSEGYWTIAYGVTKHGEPSIYNDLVSKVPVSEEEGAKISYNLKNENYGAKILNACKNLGVTKQNQFDALLSLAYNCGYGVITGDNALTRAIAEDINNESKIRPIWESFRTNGGLAGLVARRKDECNMFFGKDYEIRPILKITASGGYDGYVTENNGDGWLPNDIGESDSGGFDGYKSFTNEFGSNWLCPVKGGSVSSKYGWRTHPVTGERKFHHGTDIAISQGKPTVASKSGVISDCGFSSSMGNYIYLDCGNYRVKYMHLSKISVSKGDTVTRGQKVGEIGSTGISTGPHCHWEIRRISDNESTDPAPSLKKGDTV